MTTFRLLLWINAAIALQLAAGIVIALWRRRARVNAVASAPAVETAPATRGAWPGWREFRVVRREFADHARSQCSFYLASADGAALPPFKPGQFLTFRLQVAHPGAPQVLRTNVRCYSLSDRPTPDHYRVTIKRVPAPADRPELPPGLSSGYFHDRVREGDLLSVKAPSGHFHIDSDAAVPAVLIAGGIGITPMMSMLLWCLAEQPARAVHLYYGVRNSNEHAFKAQLERLATAHPALHLHVAYSRPGAQDVQGRDFQHGGHVDIALLRKTLPQGRHQFYVCGPSAMMESLVPALRDWGVTPQDLHYEAFGPALLAPTSAATAQTAAPVAVRFARSGRSLTWDGQDENLLAFAERQGIAVESGCRAGSCGSCETIVIEGAVVYTQTPDYAIAPGRCLLCIGQPSSTLTLEA